MWEDQLKTL